MILEVAMLIFQAIYLSVIVNVEYYSFCVSPVLAPYLMCLVSMMPGTGKLGDRTGQDRRGEDIDRRNNAAFFEIHGCGCVL